MGASSGNCHLSSQNFMLALKIEGGVLGLGANFFLSLFSRQDVFARGCVFLQVMIGILLLILFSADRYTMFHLDRLVG